MKTIFSPFKPYAGIQFLALGQAIILMAIWILLPSQVLPDPLEIAQAWNTLALKDGMLIELFKSVVTIWKAIILATIISFGIAFLSTASFFKPVAHWLTTFRFLGFAGITFLFTLWTDNGSDLKVWLLTFGMSAFMLTSAVSMVESITQEQIDYARTLRLDGWRITYELAFREKLDEILDLIRANAAVGWTLLSMVEGLVRSEGGIGDLLLNQNKHMHLSAVFAIQITILFYGLGQDYILQLIRSAICPYTKFMKAK